MCLMPPRKPICWRAVETTLRKPQIEKAAQPEKPPRLDGEYEMIPDDWVLSNHRNQ